MPVNSRISPLRAFRYRPFGSPLAGVEASVHMNFMENAVGGLPRPFAIGAVGRDERGHDQHTRLAEQGRYFADPPDVFCTLLRREAEVGAEAVPHVVAVQNEDVVTLPVQPALKLDPQGRLACP